MSPERQEQRTAKASRATDLRPLVFAFGVVERLSKMRGRGSHVSSRLSIVVGRSLSDTRQNTRTTMCGTIGTHSIAACRERCKLPAVSKNTTSRPNASNIRTTHLKSRSHQTNASLLADVNNSQTSMYLLKIAHFSENIFVCGAN